jgi:hypothetical protein
MHVRRTAGNDGRMVTKVTALVLPMLMMVAPGCGASGALVSPSPTPPRPLELLAVAPAAGGRACRLPEIRVELRLTDALRRDGVFAPERVTLRLDGNEITRLVRIGGTMDFPQGRAFLSYTPPVPLSLGQHRATLVLARPSGPSTFEWTFVVDDLPCP